MRYALYRCGLEGGGWLLWDHHTNDRTRYLDLTLAREDCDHLNYEESRKLTAVAS